MILRSLVLMMAFSFSFNSLADSRQGQLELIPQNCISLVQAQNLVLETALTARQCSDQEADEYYANHCRYSDEDILNITYSTTWSNHRGHYRSGTFYNYYAAPGAECWGGFKVDCDGNVGSWEVCED